MPVKLTVEQQKELAQLRVSANCGKEVCLCDGNFQNLPHVKQIGMQGLLECCNGHAHGCQLALPFGDTHFCKCPARAFLYHEIGV